MIASIDSQDDLLNLKPQTEVPETSQEQTQ